MAYDYTYSEKLIMSFITGISNFACLPGLMLMLKKDRPFEFFIGFFTMFTSFMYHVTESLDIEVYMTPGKWHALDNVGSICCINSLLISLMNSHLDHKSQLKYNLGSLVLVMIMQGANPWDLFNTIFPIIIFGILLCYDYFKNGFPEYNFKIMWKGLGILMVALSMFIKGLDEHSDYMRIAHSFWHLTIGMSTFYLWQVQTKKFYNFSEVYQEFWNGSLSHSTKK
jgi:hypothetical protein